MSVLQSRGVVRRARRRASRIARRALTKAEQTVRTRLNLGPTEPLARVIFEFARARPDAFIVQIGSHDSAQLDPLRQYILKRGWRGILVEPMPPVFERLQRNYAGVEGLRLENVAVAGSDGSMEMYYLPQSTDPDLPEWYDALASFNREVFLSHERFIPDIAERMRTMTVPTVTFETLMDRNGAPRADFIQIDTEGFDFEIVKLIDLDRFAPTLLQIEELHLSRDERSRCVELLAHHGYDAIGNGMDMLALRHELLGPRESRVGRIFSRFHDDPAYVRS